MSQRTVVDQIDLINGRLSVRLAAETYTDDIVTARAYHRVGADNATAFDAAMPAVNTHLVSLGHATASNTDQVAGVYSSYSAGTTVTLKTRRLIRFLGKLIAHRGHGSFSVPENVIDGLASLPAWVHGVEIDVLPTSDGVPVLMHDDTVDRTTNGTGLVSSKTLAEIKALVAGADAGVPAEIPTLAEYLDACSPYASLRDIFVDIKDESEGAIGLIVATIEASAVADRCIAMVRTDAGVTRLRSTSSTLRIGRFGVTPSGLSAMLSNLSSEGGFLALTPPNEYIANRWAISRMQDAGYKSGCSVENDENNLFIARATGCDYVLTDVGSSLEWLVS
jgi:glycerophosphoryl diester phosphodiesterase